MSGDDEWSELREFYYQLTDSQRRMYRNGIKRTFERNQEKNKQVKERPPEERPSLRLAFSASSPPARLPSAADGTLRKV